MNHAVLQLLKQGFRITIIDNLDNSVIEAVRRVRSLVGPHLSNNFIFCHDDLRNPNDLEPLFSQTKFDVVIHFAGLKGVRESVAKPRRYYDNNVVGTINLFQAMAKFNCLWSTSSNQLFQRAEGDWQIILLRYFNPVGTHESGQIGEDPRGWHPEEWLQIVGIAEVAMTEDEVVGKVRTNKTTNPVKGFNDGVVDIVDYGKIR
ncbi:hypothetical protein V8G54_009996 [Vigna mungo]|uniref:UDP-glucose 4-epimerase n=1 Tax=Vigna mungo TaxID=3915 RepID=A0AAQ3S622_VIGMU